uniref:X-box-binding protein 1 n=1 Tax=Lutzomyia longipalpis TaxID=7200 RepID=A0A1B0CFP9_LUTLO
MKIKQEIAIMQKDSNEDPLVRRRKHRLDHLTHEEKIERKKMKNRMAAQTSRDRKKIKMDNMETTIKILSEENKQLNKRNAYLEERLKELERRLGGIYDGLTIDTQSGNVQEKAMALNLLEICIILTVWFTIKRSLMESSWLMMHQTSMIPSQQKPKRPRDLSTFTQVTCITQFK